MCAVGSKVIFPIKLLSGLLCSASGHGSRWSSPALSKSFSLSMSFKLLYDL